MESLSLFIQHLSNRLRTAGSVANYLSGVKTMHVINDLDISVFDDFLIKMMVRGVKMQKGLSTKKAAPITVEILKDLFGTMHNGNTNDLTYWGLFVIAFFLLARKSNLVPDSVASFDPKKQLSRGDMVVTDEALVVTLKWSKTNQLGREETFPLLRNDGHPLCPVAAYRNMVRARPADATAPAFLIKTRGVVGTVTYRQYQDRIKKAISSLDLDPSLYSSHSFRRGGATYAFQCGVPAELIKRIGDWKSDAYLEYIDCPVSDRVKAGKLIRDHINK